MTLDSADFITGLGLALFIEGIMYALFPEMMKRMVLQILSLPIVHIRGTGLACMVLGLMAVWWVRR